MIAAGEAGGILDTILKRLATYIEKAVKLKGQVQVGDDLSDRRHRHRRRRRRRHSVEGHSDLRAAVRRPRRRAAAADPHRHRAQQQPGRASCRSSSSASAPSATAFQHVLRDRRAAARVIDAHHAEAADSRLHHAQDRRRAVLPHAVDAAQLGRADSRRPRHHRQDRRQRDHRGRDHDDAQEHRARRDDRRAAEGDRRCSRRW